MLHAQYVGSRDTEMKELILVPREFTDARVPLWEAGGTSLSAWEKEKLINFSKRRDS